jgi:hypothetical protein
LINVMKINRWILVPLVLGLATGLMLVILQNGYWFNQFLFGFVLGVIEGLIIQLWSELRTRKLAKSSNAEDYSVKQKRDLVMLVNFETAFDLCRQAIFDAGAKIKSEDPKGKIIKAKSRINFHSFGTDIAFNLKPLNENLTEIQIVTRPTVRTTIVDYGESYKLIENLTEILKDKDAELNRRILADSVSIMEDVYIKPFQKEKMKNTKS